MAGVLTEQPDRTEAPMHENMNRKPKAKNKQKERGGS
jgi:hypothetical protein